ncbi:MAG TPA: protein phosphatase 2C domain-containing protein [Ktedonobacterales bacterium]
MSALDDNAPQGTPRLSDGSDAPAPADANDRPRTLRSPLPPPLVPGLVPMPDLPQAGAQVASAPVPAESLPLPLPPGTAPTPGAAPPADPSAVETALSPNDLPPLPPLVPPAPAASPRTPRTVAASPASPLEPEVTTSIAGYGQQVERGAWQRRDKVETNDPTGDEELLHIEAGDGWAIVGASRIGRGHLHDGKYREDSLTAAITPDGWHLAAVADGGGAYRLARVGAQLAVRAAVAAMRLALVGGTGDAEDAEDAEVRGGRGEREQRFTAEETEGTEEERAERSTAERAEGKIEVRARAALVAGLRAARRALEEEAERRRAAGDEAVTAADLRTTLLLVLHRELADGSQLVAGAQVGDGLIAAREGSEGALHVLGKPETGAVGDETMFLPDVPDEAGEWEGRVRLVRLDAAGGPMHLLALTDGVSDDFAPAANHLWRLERPLFMSALLPGRPPAEAAAALCDLLGYERTGSFDDRTLVCVYRRRAAP